MSQSGTGDSTEDTMQVLSNQLKIARSEINNLRQQLTSLTFTHKKDCEKIQQTLVNFQCQTCLSSQPQPTLSPNNTNADLSLKYIGTIHTHFPEKRGTPRQPGICSDLIAKITLNHDVFTNPSHALEGLQEFSHMWVLYHFHRNEQQHVRAKVAPPRLNGHRTGVFATRSPHRPAPIGLSLVKIDRIMDGTIYFSGVDMVDGTPVLDIKPYIPQYDNPSFASAVSNTGENSSFADDSTSSIRNINSNDSDVGSNVSDINLTNQSESDSSALEPDLENRVLDGDENGGNIPSGGGAGAVASVAYNLEMYYNRATSRIGEREAPDGEEEESPTTTQSITATRSQPSTTTESQIRIPAWIDNPPVSTLTVVFKETALMQLNQLGNEAEEKKSIITNVLREDPRSVYLRERLCSHCYVFRISDLNVSCRFNDTNHTVIVYKVFPNSDNEDHT